MVNKLKFVVKNYFDEGTASPFPARLMLQMYNLRESLLRQESEKNAFNEVYAPIIDNFIEFKNIIKKLIDLKDKHLKDVLDGTAVKVHSNGQLTILKTIDSDYRALVKEFFIKGEIIISSIPRVGKIFGLKVDFFFKEEKKFKKELESFRNKYFNAEFVISHLNYARKTWYYNFNNIRNDIEHRSFKIPDIKYHLNPDSSVSVIFPIIEDGMDIIQLLEILIQDVLELVECCIIFFFSTKLPTGIFIKDIPENERDPKKVIRYRLYGRFGDQEVPYGNS